MVVLLQCCKVTKNQDTVPGFLPLMSLPVGTASLVLHIRECHLQADPYRELLGLEGCWRRDLGVNVMNCLSDSPVTVKNNQEEGGLEEEKLAVGSQTGLI